MKATISIVTKNELKKGCPIVLDVAHKDTISGRTSRTRKTIGHSLVKDWDFEKDLPRLSHPDGESLASRVIIIRDRAKKYNFTSLTAVGEGVSYLLSHRVVSSDVQEYGEVEALRLEAAGKYGTASSLRACLKPWSIFAPGLNFHDIDASLIARFKQENKGRISDTTIKAYVGALRKMYNIALYDRDMSLVDNGAFKSCMKGLRIRMRRARNVYLNDKNLKKLVDRKVKGNFVLSGAQVKALDFTLLQFYLGGANLKDVLFLKREMFYKNRVLLQRSKLGSSAEYFDVKVFKAAREIFKKYEGNDPVYWFDVRKDPVGYKTYRDRHNKNLRDLQPKIGLKLAPINDAMSSNVIRHTFATRAKFLGINADIIRELMGHERNDIDTVYKDKYPEKMRDKAHKKIIKIVAGL